MFKATRVSSASITKAARIVLNHSTHVDGLIAALTKGAALAAEAGVTTFVPGRITRTKGGAAEFLQVTVSVPISGGFRCLARRGSMIQEVFVSTIIKDESELQQLLDKITSKGK
jgi:hypothetical protein